MDVIVDAHNHCAVLSSKLAYELKSRVPYIVNHISGALTGIDEQCDVQWFFSAIEVRDTLLGAVLKHFKILNLETRDIASLPITDDYRNAHQCGLHLDGV